MYRMICLLLLFLFVPICNADIRVLEKLMSKHSIKHKADNSKSMARKAKVKSPGLKRKKIKPKSATENWASKEVKHKEVITSEDLEIRNDIAYLPNQVKPFTGKHYEYHSNAGKEVLTDSKQNSASTISRKDKKYIEIIYKDGKKNGPVTMWDENGIKIGVIYFKDGVPVE
jgi:antitoxin component YwqK of YwqJK toxin-antitoxin module